MSAITTHVLDTAHGRAASGVRVLLERRSGTGEWQSLSRGTTDADGRLRTLYPEGEPLEPGVYRLTFDTHHYFEAQGITAFYPEVSVVFETASGEPHYHVPLLLSPFGFTTYRGT
ncbi:MAG TPA: hydroxyisourate hydrolase [Vicinamibacterales bacterium]|nr:hydroxyisourate hydrolase [Vicinamibacterales bacterium]